MRDIALTIGATGEKVFKLQRRLKELGYEIDIDGDYGPKTGIIVKEFKINATYYLDGSLIDLNFSVEQALWDLLFAYETGQEITDKKPEGIYSSPIQDIHISVNNLSLLYKCIIKLAIEEVGVREIGKNSGKRINEYLEVVGLKGTGAPWCMAFVMWCYLKACEKLKIDVIWERPRSIVLQKSGHVQGYKNWAKSKNILITDLENALPGSFFIMIFSGGNGHTGVIIKNDVNKKIFTTVEGNGLPLGTNVLTLNGWNPIEKLSIGDQIKTPQNEESYVTGIYPQGIRKTYKIKFQDGSEQIADENHRWTLHKDIRTGKKSVFTTKEAYFSFNNGRGLFLPEIKPIAFSKTELPLDPYFLGLLLGDGGFTGKSTVRFSSVDSEIINYISSILPKECELKQGTNTRNTCLGYDECDYSFIGSFILNKIKELKLHGLKSDSKFIPEIYKYASIEDRLALLQGLLDTDGYVDELGRIEFSSSSKQLSLDVQFLVQSLGGKVKLSEKKNIMYTSPTQKIPQKGKNAFRLQSIRFTENSWIIPFRLERKVARYVERPERLSLRGWGISEIEEYGEEETICISTSAPSEMYIIDNFIPTHNTSVSGSREGDGVYIKERRYKDINSVVQFHHLL